MTYRIRNWRKFQHYKDRNPPWIKLHLALLSSRDWVMLDDASRVLAIASILIASQNDGNIPDDPDYVRRVAYLHKRPNFEPLISCGFLERASTMLAHASTLQADARPETYREETETEKKDSRAVAEATRTEREIKFQEFWKAYPKRDGRNPSTPASKKFTALCKSGINPDDIIAGARSYASAMRAKGKVGTEFVCMAVTWLNQQSWEIEKTVPEAERTPIGWKPGMPTSEELKAHYRRISSNGTTGNQVEHSTNPKSEGEGFFSGSEGLHRKIGS